MKKIKPLISVLTSAWNRSEYIEKVWKGLNEQSYTNFEWIIANDGSIDSTLEKCLNLKKISKFPVTIINSNIRLGKPRMDNELLKAANGEFIIWCDSDDYLVSDSLDHLIELWSSIPLNQQNEFLGIIALCSTEDGILQSTPLPVKGISDITLSEKSDFDRINGGGDNLFFIKSDKIKPYKFIEGDFMVTESSFWINFADMKMKYIPEVMKIMDRGTSNRISFSKKMEYCRGKAYAIAACENIKQTTPLLSLKFIWLLITYHRYCIHGDISYTKAREKWNNRISLFIWLSCILLGNLFALKDIMQGKVVKTHIDYDINLTKANIKIIS